MNIDTYNAMMTVKYSLQSKSSSEIYRRPDVLYDLIDKKICYYVRTSHSRYKKGCIKTNWRKRKEPSVAELRYELAFSKHKLKQRL